MREYPFNDPEGRCNYFWSRGASSNGPYEEECRHPKTEAGACNEDECPLIKVRRCEDCEGSGEVPQPVNPGMTEAVMVKCSACDGQGERRT